ncbi:MAG: hypothetical protein K0R38_1027 [Polyangiaceae bacterium]|jgi:ABC-type amino acid transport substrate-binding protein|nr:hypothetical protein [Polyangiaceae bacterium]
MKWRHVLIVIGGLALAALGVGAFALYRKITQESERLIAQMDCANALKTHPAPGECAKLSGFDLDFARAMARCLLAQDVARAAGTDPDKACQLAVVGSAPPPSGRSATP